MKEMFVGIKIFTSLPWLHPYRLSGVSTRPSGSHSCRSYKGCGVVVVLAFPARAVVVVQPRVVV